MAANPLFRGEIDGIHLENFLGYAASSHWSSILLPKKSVFPNISVIGILSGDSVVTTNKGRIGRVLISHDLTAEVLRGY